MSSFTKGCLLCGRQCRADRQNGQVGFCGAGTGLGFSSAVLHHGEEPPISGTRPGGSGVIFFTRCNLRCVFCQNWQISQVSNVGMDISIDELVEIMFRLAESGANNINLVSPTPYVVEIVQALSRARNKGLNLPVVYNSGGYDSLSALALMDGLVDIYLPDAKIAPPAEAKPGDPDQTSMRLFGVGDYAWVNRKCLEEMFRQVGHLIVDDQGLAVRGLLIRHLVLPDDLARTSLMLPWLADNYGPNIHLSLMAQYHPSHLIKLGDNPQFRDFPGLGRPLSLREYDDLMQKAWELNLVNTFVQDLESAIINRPDFNKPEVFN